MTKKLLLIFLIPVLFSVNSSAQTIKTDVRGQIYEHFWSKCVGAGRANEGLRAGWLEHLDLAKKNCGFQYVRFHGLFDDDMFVYFEKPNGKVVYNWQYIDEVYDRMLALGVRPFVELSFFPKGMDAENGKMQMWYRNRISFDPAKLGKWHDLIKAFTQHVVDRYGMDEVLTWYFEVWNEPNLNMNPKAGFWDGTKSDYFNLYKASVEAVKSVDKRLKVGGPSTSNFIADNRYEGEVYDKNKSIFYSVDQINKQQWKSPWMEEFLEFCAKEKLPLDFITTHPYPTDYALDPETGRGKNAVRYVHSVYDDITWLRSVLAKSSYPTAEIHLTEWSTGPNSRDAMHDHLPAAAYIIKVNLDCIGLAHSLSYWTFTDVFEEKGGGETFFHGGFGMINFQGIVKPSFHAYRMLNQLGDEKLYYIDPLFVSRFSKSGKVSAIAFNYPKEYEQHVPVSGDCATFMENVSSKKIDLKLTNLTPGATFQVETLDKMHGNVIDKFRQMGAPHSPNPTETEILRQEGWSTAKELIRADENGVLYWKQELSPWSCVLLREL